MGGESRLAVQPPILNVDSPLWRHAELREHPCEAKFLVVAAGAKRKTLFFAAAGRRHRDRADALQIDEDVVLRGHVDEDAAAVAFDAAEHVISLPPALAGRGASRAVAQRHIKLEDIEAVAELGLWRYTDRQINARHLLMRMASQMFLVVGTNYYSIGSISRCAQVLVGEQRNGWYRVQWNGSWGWVAGRYISWDRGYCSNRSGGYARTAPKRSNY